MPDELATSVSDDFIVAKTTLPGCEFLGLFANRHMKAGELICKYTGTVYRTIEAIRRPDKSYLMRLGEQCYVDALAHFDCVARYINDCIEPRGWNVRFEKHAEEKCAYVIALRDILPGEEIFVDYGKWYWASGKPVRLELS